MKYTTLSEFVHEIDKLGELYTVEEYANPDLEISELADRMSKQIGGGKALLFINNGTKFPVLINSMGSTVRMKTVLRVDDYNQLTNQIFEVFKNITESSGNIIQKIKKIPHLIKLASYIPKIKPGRGICQDFVYKDPDLSMLPILKTWFRDGGKFITFPQVITKDPSTGIRNVGMYRMQVLDKNTTGMHWHKHKVGARHYEEHKKLGTRMPIAVALGGDPVYTYSATAPLPDNTDEYLLAGFLRKKRVKLVKAITQNIEVPADADFIIEGYVDPKEDLVWEGPFGDHTGFFSLADWYPKFHVTCITHKKNAIYPATVVGIPPMEDAHIAKATEKIFLAPIKLAMLPEMRNMNIPDAGVAHNLTIVSIEKNYSGHALKVMNSLWGAGQMMFNKMMIVFDAQVNIDNYETCAKIISQTVNPSSDLHFIKGPLDILDHSSDKFSFGSKIGIDATIKYKEELNAIQNQNIKYSDISIDIDTLYKTFPEIKLINTNLLKKDISFVFISIDKTRKKQVLEISKTLFELSGFENIKFVVILDSPVNVFDVETAVWIFANNIEPMRDCYVIESTRDNESSHLVIDGTRKRTDIDNFKRNWPDIVTADEQTIKLVDSKWEKYKIGPFISSPSIKFKSLILSKTAIVE